MKKIMLIASLSSLVLVSCINIKFEEPQPQGGKDLALIPKELQGSYLIDEHDTLRFYANRMVTKKKDTTEIVNLSDVFILRKFKEYYIINQKDDRDSTWAAFFIKRNKNTNPNFYIMSYDTKDSTIIDKLQSITKTKIVETNGNVNLIVKPSPKELEEIINLIGLREIKIPKLSQ
jgi:hypothetical protein